MSSVVRAYEAKITEVVKDDMSLVARINTSDVDYYRTVIDPKGVKFDNYRALRLPILWEHGKDVHRRYTDPIGNALWIRTNGGERPTEIIARPRFLADDFSRQRWEWYRDGIITGWSVNIIPDEGASSPPTAEELRSRPDWEPAELIYRSSTLIEFSGTVCPGNPKAVTDERAARVMDLVGRNLLWLPDEVRPVYEEAAARAAPPAEPEATPAPDPPTPRRDGPYVEADGDAWAVRDADGAIIAAFPEERLARRCLELMATPSARIDDVIVEAVTAERAFAADLRDRVAAMVDLWLTGRV